MEANICYECRHSFISCICKSCLKCGTAFMKYFRTNFIKGRSHCRVCASPVCISCIISKKGYQKVCTRCQIKDKEEKLNTEKAIFAVSEAKFGLVPAQTSSMTNLKSDGERKEAFFAASKKGLDHILMTLIDSGCDVNYKDANYNTPLHYAAQGGFIAAAALLIEKGANIKAANNIGWTALHFVASKGSSDNHIECAKFLLEMGLDVLTENNIGETASNVADRCGAKLEMIQLLKAVEVEVAMEELADKSKKLIETAIDLDEKRLGTAILTLLNFVSLLSESESNSKSSSNFSSFASDLSDNKEESELDDGDAIIVEKFAYRAIKPINVEKEHFSRNVKYFVDRAVSPIEEGLRVLMEDTQVNEDLENLIREKKEWEERCQQLLFTVADSNKDCESTLEEKKEWQERYEKLMNESACFKIEFQNSLLEKKEWEDRCQELMNTISVSNNKYKKIIEEKDEWEERCRKMMTTLADSSKEHKRQMDQLKEEQRIYKNDKEDELAKHDAAYVNKLNKQKQDYEMIKSELQERLGESEISRQELLVIQKNMKLTWIPDEFVSECQQESCRSAFSVTGRKHHCRCCGRVFCLKCSQRKADLKVLGYTKPVRVCDTCYTLANSTLATKVS